MITGNSEFEGQMDMLFVALIVLICAICVTFVIRNRRRARRRLAEIARRGGSLCPRCGRYVSPGAQACRHCLTPVQMATARQ
ncbi:hypothetical protein N5K27_15405 [Pigmentiphaga sp. GD03639]|uniref:hypothetical protein n=1 Tax=Pigmentiphaga sp. GD03639 TaxID=2975354 RepID=UPI0024484C17|nr:hypothetical protein [Pigmentiphaga sp. GD03639]MDH2237687.1 hypothetical protein [Pigmentiphaga sp. GD03639]